MVTRSTAGSVRGLLGCAALLMVLTSGCRLGYADVDAAIADTGMDTASPMDSSMDALVDAPRDADAAMPDADAAMPDADAGIPDGDTGSPDGDAGMPDSDAGMPDGDAGSPGLPLTNLPSDTFTRISSSDLVWSARFTFDTTSDSMCDFIVPQAGTIPDICVVGGRTVTVSSGAIVTVTGSRALALVALTTMVIDGTIDLSPGTTPNGPGASPMTGTGTMNSGGTGGGGNGSAGGRGGNGFTELGGGGGAAVGDFLSPLVGGQSGGFLMAMLALQLGGGGGGAIELVAGDSIELRARRACTPPAAGDREAR